MDKTRKGVIAAVIVSIVSVIIIISSVVLLTGEQSLPPLPSNHGHIFDIYGDYVGKDADGYLVVQITELYREYHSLSEVKIYVYNMSSERVDFSDNGITLMEAKQNYQNPQFDGNISYYDKDNNDIVTVGDEIIIKDVAIGSLEVGGYLKIFNHYEVSVIDIYQK